MNVVIVIPTYNERDNIAPLIDELERHFPDIPHSMHILVVDDDSPDGTAEVVRTKMAEYGNIFMIGGRKAGLGAAYVRGMAHALNELKADAVFEMDGDFSHDPADVSRMMEAFDRGADMVIGSRYVQGGGIPADWGFRRKSISRGGNLVARFVAGLQGIRDCTAGFRAIRSSVLKKIDLHGLNVRGYAFQIVLLQQLLGAGARVVEIPVQFVDRSCGSSKMRISDIAEFIVSAARLRFQVSREFLSFAVVGALGVVVNLASFCILLKLGVPLCISSPAAIELSIISNFILNNYWTFGNRTLHGGLTVRGVMFNAVSLLALGVSYSTFLILNAWFPSYPPYFHQLASIVPAAFVNYFLNSSWTFHGKKELS